MHALARAPSFTVSRSPSAARRRRTRAPAQAESSSAKSPSRPEQAMATAERASSRGARNATTAERLTYEARIKSQLLRDGGGVRGFGAGGRVEGGGRGDGGAASQARPGFAGRPSSSSIALVPFVVVQAISLPCTASRVNSSGELPSAKPAGLTAFRSPASRARPAFDRACSSVAYGMIERAPFARAYAALEVKRRTSMTTATSERVVAGRG